MIFLPDAMRTGKWFFIVGVLLSAYLVSIWIFAQIYNQYGHTQYLPKMR